MSWLTYLSNTYDNHNKFIGQFDRNRFDREYALIPVSHTTQTAHIEVYLDGEGNYQYARVVDKSEGSTIIPCTEASASRTSSPVPHPLFDKLVYVAGDYAQYGGESKGTPHADYMEQLRNWCQSPYAHDKVKSVYAYLQKGKLIGDLVQNQILWVDEHNRLLGKPPAELDDTHKGQTTIFKVIASEQSAAFVRFAVQIPGDIETRLWRDRTVQQSFIDYYEQSLLETEICYATGEVKPYADKHANRIRNSGDKSKLISANDSTGFTYRGRFQTSREAATISYEVSQKAHNALKWLIEKQGIQRDGRVFLVWGTEEASVPNPQDELSSLFLGPDDDDEESFSGDSTHKEYAEQVRKALNGFRFDGDYKSNVIIMVLDAATPGRMSIVYYRDMNKEKYINQLQAWHESCYWQHRRKNGEGKQVSYLGAPSNYDIAIAAYGSRANDKLIKGLMERLLPCIVDGRDIPRDIVRSAVARTSNPVAMEPWEWEKALGITCALVKKNYEKEGFSVSLNKKSDDRSYLFGRLLAIADVLESRVLFANKENRATNATRYMSAFSQRPEQTWKVIYSNLQPYFTRYGAKFNHYKIKIDEVMVLFREDEFNNRPLTGKYLLALSSQRHELYKGKDEEDEALHADSGTLNQD